MAHGAFSPARAWRPAVVARLARTLDPAIGSSGERTCVEYVFDVPSAVLTIYETPIFVAEAAKIWTTEERLEFFAWIAGEPEAGSVIAGSGGCRKVRWSRPGMGKQGGARVIYFPDGSGRTLHAAGVPEGRKGHDPRPHPEGDS